MLLMATNVLGLSNNIMGGEKDGFQFKLMKLNSSFAYIVRTMIYLRTSIMYPLLPYLNFDIS